jgi:hypothetical protein
MMPKSLEVIGYKKADFARPIGSAEHPDLTPNFFMEGHQSPMNKISRQFCLMKTKNILGHAPGHQMILCQ